MWGACTKLCWHGLQEVVLSLMDAQSRNVMHVVHELPCIRPCTGQLVFQHTDISCHVVTHTAQHIMGERLVAVG